MGRLAACAVLAGAVSVQSFLAPAPLSQRTSTVTLRMQEAASSSARTAPAASGPGGSQQLKPVTRRTAARVFSLGLGLSFLEGSPVRASDAPQQTSAAVEELPQISLDKFYELLREQKVELVEFDGPLFQKAVITTEGKQYLIGEGYPKESSSSPQGPLQVLGKIKNEIKAGNPVQWKWKGGTAFKKRSSDESEGKKKEDAGATNKSPSQAFKFSLPLPPKTL